MIIHTEELHMLEWSRGLKQFRVSPLVHALADNQTALMHQKQTDKLTVWVGPKDACEAMSRLWHGRLNTPPAEIDIYGAAV